MTLGACPYKAVLVKDEEGILREFLKKDSKEQEKAAEAFAAYAREHVRTGSNMRGSAQYRSHLVQVLVKRALIQAGGREHGNKVWLNGRKIQTEIQADTLLLDLLREKECYSVKRGCETANCGLCTVLVEDKPVLSCSMLAARVEEKHVVTLEGLQERQKNWEAFWQEKEQSSAVSVIRDL